MDQYRELRFDKKYQMNSNETAVRYIHEETEHNLQSPKIIVPELIARFNPRSVVDVGCGIGTFLKVFKDCGVADVTGVDGKWVDRKKLMIGQKEFVEKDLELPIGLDRTFDLVLCLEVAEHLAEKSADTIVESLTGLGKTIVFSAATDKQGGQNHINEQSFPYWKAKFEARGYQVIDFFRPLFWNERKIQWWYKQNMFLVIHESVDARPFRNAKKEFSPDHVVIHPDLYFERLQEYVGKCQELDNLRIGNGGNVNLYLGLLLRKLGLWKQKGPA